MRVNNYLWGILAGLIGGAAGAMILWGSWLLPALGLLLTRVDLIRGMATMLVLGSLGGIIYSLVIGRTRLSLNASILTGLALGTMLWVGGVLVAVPMLLGLPPQLANPQDHWMPLIAFLFYGAITALLYSYLARDYAPSRLRTALGLLAVAAISAPLLLRAAVSTDPRHLEIPPGWQAEVVAKGLTYAPSIALGADGVIYVAEAGYSYGPKTTVARILRIDGSAPAREIARDFEGPINGLLLSEDLLYVSHRGTITCINLDTGEREDLVTNLPALGDHQNNDMIIGHDGALYFGLGTVTNAGVVGSDNFIYAWADRYPQLHDYPSRDFDLTGELYEALDLGSIDPLDTETTGAFAPFGEQVGESVAKTSPANGVIHRLDLETGDLSVYADGLRNPYGLALDSQGTMYATNLGYDDRGVRAVAASPDWIIVVKEDSWYGWPDFAGEVPLTNPGFATDRGLNREPLIANPPPVEPPLATLPPHWSPMKLDWCPASNQLYVAIFGDGQPMTEDLDQALATGIITIDPETGEYQWFARNKDKPRAGRRGDGWKRIIDVKTAPDGTVYVLDFGVMEFTDLAPNSIPNTGVLWKLSPPED